MVTATWNVKSGAILYDDKAFQIKGVNVFGFETCSYVVHGLWVHPLTWYFDFLEENKFNVLRIPFSQQWVLDNFYEQMPDPNMITADSSLQGKKSYEILDMVFVEAYKRKMFVLLDMHRLDCSSQSQELWYSLDSNKYTAETFFRAWKIILDRYATYPSFHGTDLLNEPRGLAEWGNNPSTSWNLFVGTAIENLSSTYKDMLFYIQGVDWGRSFAGMKQYPILTNYTRIVYSPHVYGPSVVGEVSLDVLTLHAYWHSIFGFLIDSNDAICIGEYGGRYTGADKVWQDLFVSYLISIRVPGIYWTMSPNSADTGGLLKEDWTTPEQGKLDLLARLQPNPTILGRRHLRLTRS